MTSNNQNSERFKPACLALQTVLCILCDLLVAVCRVVMRTLLWIAKNVWKRYFNIETPVYKLWWAHHSRVMQKKLDQCHKINY